MSIYYSDEYLTNHDYLQHYGKKGMKWGVINTIKTGINNGLGGGGGETQDLDTAIAEKEKHCKQILARMEGMDKNSPMYNKAKQAYYKELNALKGLQNKKAAQGTKEFYKKLEQKAKNDNSVEGKLKTLQKGIEKELGVKQTIKRVDSKGMSFREAQKKQHDTSLGGKVEKALGVKTNLKPMGSKSMSLEEMRKHQHDSSISGKIENAGKAIKKKAKKTVKKTKTNINKGVNQIKEDVSRKKKKVESFIDSIFD